MTEKKIRLIIGGDVMLGRLVKEQIITQGINPLNNVTKIMQRGDITLINLECAITTHLQRWSGIPKAFYFGAPPEAAEILKKTGVNLVSVANNHILDFDTKGLFDTLDYLKNQHIQYAGAGKNITEALEPTYITINDTKFGLVAFCDHQEDFAAQSHSSGIAYINLEHEEKALSLFKECLTQMKKNEVNWPILSLHWGPNMVNRPSQQFVRIAHKIIDMGYKILFGHSAHVFHGIEIYKKCPIFYAAGDLVDDYYVDPAFQNNHQLLFELEIEADTAVRILLHPVFIENCQVKPANKDQFKFIFTRAKTLFKEMGTEIKQKNQHLIIEIK